MPKKSFGQNFITDTNTVKMIASNIFRMHQAFPDAQIVEFGPGTGALTQALLQLGLSFSAVERDRDLIPLLREKFSGEIKSGRLNLFEEDGIQFDLKEVQKKPGQQIILVGNLPYHLTSSFFFKTLNSFKSVLGAIYLIQKEVADRVVAPEGSKIYGMMSVLLQAKFTVRKVRDISRQVFFPPPKVTSSLIELRRREDLSENEEEWREFEKLVKKAFSQRRKKLRNVLKVDSALLNSVGLNPETRAEELSVSELMRLFQTISK